MSEPIKTPALKEEFKPKHTTATSVVALMINDKGGVGKSTVTASVYEYLTECGMNPFGIDLDKGNSEFAKVYLPKDYKPPAIDNPEGFRLVYDMLTSAPQDRPVVVATPAHFFQRAQEHSPAFLEILSELNDQLAREVRPVFTLDDKRDSFNYLVEVEKYFGHSKIDVIRNTFFAQPNEFDNFNSTKLCSRIIEAGGHIIDFPVLAGRITRKINKNRWSRAQTLANLDRFDVIEYSRWWKLVCEVFRKAEYGP